MLQIVCSYVLVFLEVERLTEMKFEGYEFYKLQECVWEILLSDLTARYEVEEEMLSFIGREDIKESMPIIQEVLHPAHTVDVEDSELLVF